MLQQVLLLSSGRSAQRRLGAAAVGVLTTLLLLVLHLALRPGPRYVLVIDAGSSGTRMYAYTWRDAAGAGGAPALAAVPSTAAPHKVPRRTLPGKRAYQRVETEPGLDKFEEDKAGLQAKALGPLLGWAEAVVPRRQWARTPVFLFGTAGLRKLSEHQQVRLLESVRSVLKRSAFRFEQPWARIITGADEGVYGWIALNYLEGRLQPSTTGEADQDEESSSGGDTLGVLDLGGSSLEVTFAADSVPWQEDAVNATLLGITHKLYAHVHHHYGLNDAFDRAVSILLSRLAPSVSSNDSSKSPDELRQQQQQRQQQQGGSAGSLSGSSSSGSNSSNSSNSKSGSHERHSAAEQAGVVASDKMKAGQGGGEEASAAAAAGSTGGSHLLQAPAVLQRQLLLSTDDPGSSSGAQEQEQQGNAHGRQLGELPVVHHPCLHEGYRQQYRRLRGEGAALPEPAEVMLVGRPDFGACQQLAHAVVNASVPCSAPPCALGAPQPATAGLDFVALTGFFVVFRFFRLPHHASMAQLEEAGRAFCGKSWAQVQAEYADELMVEDYCFRAPYIASLIRQGLLLSDKQLRIGGGDVGWTLGAALAEGYRLGGMGRRSGGKGVLFSRSGSLPVLWLLAGAVAAAAAVALAAFRWRQRWPGGGSSSGGRMLRLGWLLGRSGVLGKLQTKRSAELISLAVDAHPSPPTTDRSSPLGSTVGTGGGASLTSLVYPGTLSSMSSRTGSPLPTARSSGWLSARTTGGGGAAAAAGQTEAGASLAGSPSWAAQRAAPTLDGGSSSVGSPAGLLPHASSYSSNLNRLGRSRTFSRRSLATSTDATGE